MKYKTAVHLIVNMAIFAVATHIFGPWVVLPLLAALVNVIIQIVTEPR